MTNLCDHCTCKGDFHACSNTPCGQHDSWYAQQLLLKLEAAKKALQFYADGKHYDTVALEDHPETGLKHTRLLDNGGIAEEVLGWINEAEDAHNQTPTINQQDLVVEYQEHPAEEDPEEKLKAIAQRLKDSLNDPYVWSVGYTQGTEPPSFVIYRSPSFLAPKLPTEFEGYGVVLQTASKPVML